MVGLDTAVAGERIKHNAPGMMLSPSVGPDGASPTDATTVVSPAVAAAEAAAAAEEAAEAATTAADVSEAAAPAADETARSPSRAAAQKRRMVGLLRVGIDADRVEGASPGWDPPRTAWDTVFSPQGSSTCSFSFAAPVPNSLASIAVSMVSPEGSPSA